ncbi:DNA mismatch repair endonuclease MutL [Candidatus Dependentiae bacterium]|nr:DNA mismatch repair endonuclease MutL [Candidatus Dependentiae bacterium]
MNKIKILSEKEAQKIAAGEVVERPANIVKEILENSIDASSTQISLYIKNAGKKLIRILDNGCGMSKNDAKLCFATHATSKINNLDDLEKINSFGFRGEALASISSVSKVTLKTKLKEEDLGIKINYSQNKLISEEKISIPAGTDLEIEDLFYNLPVRKKFLKQDETEWNQILNTFQAFCLSNINIHFKLFKDDRLIINAPTTKILQERITQLWGHNFSQNLINLVDADPKHYRNSDIKFNGLLSNHNFWRYGRQQIFFFVNNRYVKDKDLSKALLKGYIGVLPPARFPAAFIFLKVPNNFVDINVHPKKEEVRFIKPVTVTNYLQRLVKETLDQNVRNLFGNNTNSAISKPKDKEKNTLFTSSKINIDKNNSNYYKIEQLDTIQQNNSEQTPFALSEATCCKVEGFNKIINTTSDFYNQDQKETKLTSNVLRPRILEYEKEQKTIYEEKKVDTRKEFKIIGQLLRTYIIAQSDENLVLIDQHDAHERVIYDRITKKFENHHGTKLMFPEIIELNIKEIEQIKQAQVFLKKQGIETEFFGKNQLAIKSSPPQIQNQSLKELIFEILEFIKENEKLDTDSFRKKLNDRVHAQIACKSAVKAGDTLSMQQMEKIVNDLQKTSNPLTCPHGRPTTWIINKHQIEKQFKRKL